MKSKTYCEGFNTGKMDASLLAILNNVNDIKHTYADINEKYKRAINIFEQDEFLTGYGDGFDYYNLGLDN